MRPPQISRPAATGNAAPRGAIILLFALWSWLVMAAVVSASMQLFAALLG